MVLQVVPFIGDVPVERSDPVLVEMPNNDGNVSDEEFDMPSIVDVRSSEEQSRIEEQQHVTDMGIGETSQNAWNAEHPADEDAEETQIKRKENTTGILFCRKCGFYHGPELFHGLSFSPVWGTQLDQGITGTDTDSVPLGGREESEMEVQSSGFKFRAIPRCTEGLLVRTQAVASTSNSFGFGGGGTTLGFGSNPFGQAKPTSIGGLFGQSTTGTGTGTGLFGENGVPANGSQSSGFKFGAMSSTPDVSSTNDPFGYGSGVHEQKLKTQTLAIQSKRFNIQVKEAGSSGYIFKIVEVRAGSVESCLTLDISSAVKFRDQLAAFHDSEPTQFSGCNSDRGPQNQDVRLPKDKSMKGVIMASDNKKYHIDLEENEQGRLLKVWQKVQEGDPTILIAIPAQGLKEFCDALTDLLEDFETDDDHAQCYGPVSPPKKSDDDSNLTEERGYKPKVKPPEEKHTDAARLIKNVMCNVCSKEESNIVFLPCGHLISCDKCATRVKMCMLCSTAVKKKQRVYRH